MVDTGNSTSGTPDRHFRKYANRKFYDVDKGRYASVKQIASVVARGSHVEVVDDRTGRDLTLEMMARILYEEIKARGKSDRAIPVMAVQITKLIRLF